MNVLIDKKPIDSKHAEQSDHWTDNLQLCPLAFQVGEEG